MENEVQKNYINTCIIIVLVKPVADLMRASVELDTKSFSGLGTWRNWIHMSEKNWWDFRLVTVLRSICLDLLP